jgi:uncharacterized phage protein gp47/JayE
LAFFHFLIYSLVYRGGLYMTFGLTPTGFNKKTLSDLTTSMDSKAKGEFGDGVKLSNRSLVGKTIGIVKGELADLWSLAESVYNAFYPGTASGEALDRAISLTGTVREGSSNTKVTCQCVGDGGTIIQAGKIVQNPTTRERYLLTESVTIPAGGSVDSTFEAEESGEIYALAGSVTEIVTPVAGWTSVSNAADQTVLGAPIESDPEVRERRQDEINTSGGGTPEGIRAYLLDQDNIPGIEDAYVFENDTFAEVDGRPPKSMEAVIAGGDDDDIANALWQCKGGGIQFVGSASFVIQDSQGFDRTMYYSRPTDREVYLDLEYTANEDFPADGESQLEANILQYGDALGIGGGIIITQMITQFDVAGIVDFTLKLDLDGAAVTIRTIGDGIEILRDATGVEISRWDSARVNIHEAP